MSRFSSKMGHFPDRRQRHDSARIHESASKHASPAWHDFGTKNHCQMCQMSHLSHPQKVRHSATFATFGALHKRNAISDIDLTAGLAISFLVSCSTVLAREGERVALLADFGTKNGVPIVPLVTLPQKV
jgi:hypothetical protein